MIDRSYLESILEKRVLILDGAMGTMLQRQHLTEEDFRADRFHDHKTPLMGNNDVLVLTRPDIIASIHWEYLQAGADIIETNTFCANSITQADYHLSHLAAEISEAGAKLARQTVDRFMKEYPERECFVAASIGPTNRTASMSPDANRPGYRAVTFDDLVSAYSEQIEALICGGVDLLMMETVFDTLNLKAGLFAVETIQNKLGTDLPVMVSVTFSDASGRTLSGQTLEGFWNSVAHARIFSVGMNCGLGAEQLRPYIYELSELAPDVFISCHPNAGLPDEFGNYSNETPEHMGNVIREFVLQKKINIVGGCCGTNPDFIRAIARSVCGLKPRIRTPRRHLTRLSGLEAFTVRPDMNFVNIGERTNVAGSKKFLRLIKEENYEEALAIARHQVENGAQIIDVNMDDGMLDAKVCMREFLNLLASEPEISRVPIMIDSSDWEVIETGLKCLQGKGVVNSISLKEGEEVFLDHARLIHRYGAAMVVMAFDEKSQAVTLAHKIEVCQRAYHLLTEKAGIPPEDIIFDPNVLMVGAGMEGDREYAMNFIESVRWIKNNLPYAKTSGGISNVSFAFRGKNSIREAMHTVFLYHAVKAGLDMGIVNAAQLGVYEDIEPELRGLVEDLLLNRRADATDRLLEYASRTEEKKEKTDQQSQKQASWRELPARERVITSLVKGIGEYVQEDIMELLSQYPSALKVIEEPLMDGMKEVGQLFGEGKMFLPQVIKSARVMRKSVDVLAPYLEQMDSLNNDLQKQNKKILLATVKGDVHDIGKNIVGIVLKCNHYDVIDLGTMVPCEDILKAALEHNVDAIGLSGLITPSLLEIEHVARAMQKARFKIPLFVGGATTSPEHTAVKLAPQYDMPVVYIRDASLVVGVLDKLLNPIRKYEYVEKLQKQQEHEREQVQIRQAKRKAISLEEARKTRFCIEEDYVPPEPSVLGIQTLQPTFEELAIKINWTAFFYAWLMRGKYPEILNNSYARDLFNDAQRMIQRLEEEKIVGPRGVFGIFPAYSENETIIINGDQELKTERQLFRKPEGLKHYALADFILPKGERKDYIGALAVTTGDGIVELGKHFKEEGDDYNYVLIHTLANRFAEAFAEYTHQKMRDIWGIGAEPDRGIRPAPGYPTCPDHSQKALLFKLLNATKNTGISLTESYMMSPVSSVCAWVFSHPSSNYFTVKY